MSASKSGDAAFTGSIPDAYETNLVPLLFTPYALDLTERVAERKPARILELAAGTGAVTRALAKRLPQSAITMTDLNGAMLEKARSTFHAANVTAQICDATSLPFDDDSVDAVVAQFGVMFFPDRIMAYREARRVLLNGGSFTFNSWGALAANPPLRIICDVFKDLGGAPCFLERVPFSYNDHAQIRGDLAQAGFESIELCDVEKVTTVQSAAAFFDALVPSSPLAADFQGLGDRAEVVSRAIVNALEKEYGHGTFANAMSAVVAQAR